MQFVFLKHVFLLASISQLMNRKLGVRFSTVISLRPITSQKAMVFNVTPYALADTHTPFLP